MATLLQLRDALALLGSAQAQQLSRQLATPLPLVEAMLERLVAIGKVEQLQMAPNDCSSGRCQGCAETAQCCSTVFYRLK
ncbi:FeoC-like transcriptional regulator [Serratia microhaemolytica]|uniref:FeoC-like transcriptional regulator n=1 Tax=Serratia microhaemolytica TaxID=2675110 RepID=UPI000FDEB0FB|nr:FeoC-like transcriptional regulator [Serratia microhaemolytica]